MVDDHAPGQPATVERTLKFKLSKNTLKTSAGECTHAGRADEDFCHSRTHSPGLCHRGAGWGTKHVGAGRCKMHFGNAPNAAKAGAIQLAEKRARKELEQVNYPAAAIENPLEELSRLAGEALRWKDIVAAHLAELHTLRYSVLNDDGSRSEQIRGEVIVYERALANAGRLLVAIGRLNIDERMVRIEERKAEVVIKALEAGLRAGGVDQSRWERARTAAGAELRVLTA